MEANVTFLYCVAKTTKPNKVNIIAKKIKQEKKQKL